MGPDRISDAIEAGMVSHIRHDIGSLEVFRGLLEPILAPGDHHDIRPAIAESASQ